MKETEFLLHPDLVESIPIVGEMTKRVFNERIAETIQDDLVNDPDLTIVIRTLNEARQLEKLFMDINRQLFAREVEVVVVDNDSDDNTAQVAKSYGAEVVTLSRQKFTYPRSMNLGVEAASFDTVFLTVGHALLSNIYNLHAGARHFKDEKVAGVYGYNLTNDNASLTEKLVKAREQIRPVRKQSKIEFVGMGALGATNAMIDRSVWDELGRFDERYESGGEDTALARLMYKAGYDIILEPALTVHHSHGVGLFNYIRQYKHWKETVEAPRQLDKTILFSRRPDLRQEV